MAEAHNKYESDTTQWSPRLSSGNILAIFVALMMMRTFIIKTTGLGILGTALDASIVLLALFEFAKDLSRRVLRRIIFTWLVSLVAFSFLSIMGGYSKGIAVAVSSSFLFAKIYMFFVATQNIRPENIRRTMYVLAVLHIVGICAQLALPNFFASLLPETTYEIDSARLSGFLINANRSGAISSLLALYFWFVVPKRYISVVFFIALFLSESRSFSIFTLGLFSYIQVMRAGHLGRLIVLPFLLIGALAVSEFIEVAESIEKMSSTLTGDGRYIRIALFAGGTAMALRFFPFGTGGGTFGSSMSANSPVYDVLGIGHWSTVEDMNGIYDNGFGALIGEYGIIGLIVAAWLLYSMFKWRKHLTLSRTDRLVLVAAVLLLSLFRTVIADFFYSAYILCLAIIISASRNEGQRKE